jgi:hypothetical protein
MGSAYLNVGYSYAARNAAERSGGSVRRFFLSAVGDYDVLDRCRQR